MDTLKIGKFIADLRKEKGLTQKDLAAQINVTDKAVSKWETGRGLPDPSIWLQLCDCLQVSVSELLVGERVNHQDHTVIDRPIVDASVYFERKSKSKYRKVIAGAAVIVCLISIGYFSSAYKYLWASFPTSDPATAVMKYGTLNRMTYSEDQFWIRKDDGFFDTNGGQRYFVHGVHSITSGNTISFFYLKEDERGLHITSYGTGP